MTTSVTTQELDQANFAPYGKLVDRPGRPSDISSRDLEYWGGLATLACEDPLDVGWLKIMPHQMVIGSLEHHRQTSELLVALDEDILIPVARNQAATNQPDLASIRVFRLRGGSGVIIAPSVWHTLPLPTQGSATCLVVFRQGTVSDDFHEVALGDPVSVIFE